MMSLPKLKLTPKQFLGLLALFLLSFSLPLTVYLVKQRQQIRGRAQEVQTEQGTGVADSPYGVHGGPSTGATTAEQIQIAEYLAEAGVKWTRPVKTAWFRLQPTEDLPPEQWAWKQMDEHIQISHNYGFQVLFLVGDGIPRWASSCSGAANDCDKNSWRWAPRNISEWERYVREVVKRYGSRGKNQVSYWEFWPEAEGSNHFLVPVGMNKAEEFYRFLKATYTVIKQEDPSAKVIYGGPVHFYTGAPEEFLVFLHTVLSKPDIGNYIDIFGFHFYERFHRYDAADVMVMARDLLSRHNLANKPMWMTEGSPDREPNIEIQAQRMPEWYSLFARNGFSKVFWFYTVTRCYIPRDNNEFPCDLPNDAFKWGGLLKTNFIPQPEIYNAYKNMAVTYTPPDQPTLVSPANNSQTTNPRPTFKWNAVSPGSNPLAGYLIQIDTDSNFLSPDFERFIQAPTLEFTPSIIAKGTYFWRVKARDNQGNFGSWSNAWQVTINPHYLAQDSPFGLWAILYTRNAAGDGIYPGKTDEAVRKITEAGVKFVRAGANWVEAESTKGTFNWTKADARIQILANYGLKPVVILGGTPLWASQAPDCCRTTPIPDTCPRSDDPGAFPPPFPANVNVRGLCWNYQTNNIEDYKNYVRQVVGRYGYGPGGKRQVKYWEIWNEPDGYNFFRGNANDFFQRQKAAYEEIKRVDPTAQVLTASFTAPGIMDIQHNYVKQGFVAEFFRLGGGNYFDIFNFHSYGKWTNSHDKWGEPEEFVSKARTYSSKPIWMTESNPGPMSDLDGQAGNMADWYRRFINAGAEKIFWFYVLDFPAVDPLKYKACGLFTDNSTLNTTACYTAHKNMAVYYTTPGQPVLVSPANNSQITNPRPTFKWNAVSPGSEGLAGYMIQVDNDSNFLNPEFFEFTTATEFPTPGGTTLTPGTYFWRVKAKDNQGNFGSWSESWKVTIELANLTFKVKFQGITIQRPNKTVTLVLKQGTTEKYRFNNLSISASADGVYTGTVSNILPGTYDLYIKGWAHLQKKFANVNLNSGDNNQDFSGVILKAGDAVDNNSVDIYDYNKVVEHFGPRMPSHGSLADFDLDGDVDIFDYNYLVGNFGQAGD